MILRVEAREAAWEILGEDMRRLPVESALYHLRVSPGRILCDPAKSCCGVPLSYREKI